MVDLVNIRDWQNKHLKDLKFKDLDVARFLNFFNSKLENITFEDCKFYSPDFRMAKLVNCKFIGCEIEDFVVGLDTHISQSEFKDCNFTMRSNKNIKIEDCTFINSTCTYIQKKDNKWETIDCKLGEVLITNGK